MSAQENSSDNLSDSEFTKHGIGLWINNKPQDAINHLSQRKQSLTVMHGYVLLKFVVTSFSI